MFDSGHSILLSFSIFLILSYRYGYRKFMDLLDRQITVIKESLHQAEEERELALSELYTKRRRHLSISDEVDSILKDAKNEIVILKEKLLEDLELIKKSRAKIADATVEQYKHDVNRHLTSQVVNLTLDAMHHILDESMSEEDKERRNDLAIDEIGETLECLS